MFWLISMYTHSLFVWFLCTVYSDSSNNSEMAYEYSVCFYYGIVCVCHYCKKVSFFFHFLIFSLILFEFSSIRYYVYMWLPHMSSIKWVHQCTNICCLLIICITFVNSIKLAKIWSWLKFNVRMQLNWITTPSCSSCPDQLICCPVWLLSQSRISFLFCCSQRMLALVLSEACWTAAVAEPNPPALCSFSNSSSCQWNMGKEFLNLLFTGLNY